ncbi:MAG: NFACT family protein [Candidatus Altiarchaeota archaeon]
MKTELSSVDLRVLVRELKGMILGSRVDKVYLVGERELLIKLYGKGSLDLVCAPNFICVTRYKRAAPERPDSFVMQLRKHLRGSFVRDVVQHGFDRIIELHLDNHILILELFSKGNVILCDKNMKILGLLDWQKWRDRVLGVGRTYDYPPSVVNPFEVDEVKFIEVMSGSGRGVASTLATKFSLGGFYAEQVCAKAGLDPKAGWGESDGSVLWDALCDFTLQADSEVEARLSADNVTPFGKGGKGYQTFNEAVDEYFSMRESEQSKADVESNVAGKRKKIGEIIKKQEDALARAREGVGAEKMKGDTLYQAMNEVNAIVSYVKEERRKGASDSEILECLKSHSIVKGLDGFILTLEFDNEG